jgi:Spy/CpxP family protein refolding chaperone
MLLAVTYVYAQGPDFGPRHRGMHESWGPGKGHYLTPEQKTNFKELFRKFREENAKLIGDMVTKRLELQSLWNDPKSDSKDIQNKAKELRDLLNHLSDKVIQSMLEARKFLTPEQIEQFNPGCGMGGDIGRGHMKGLDYRMFR